MRLESELTSLWWKIRWNEIIFIQNQSDRSLDASKPLFSNFASNESKSEQQTAVSSIQQALTNIDDLNKTPVEKEPNITPINSAADLKNSDSNISTMGTAVSFRHKPHIRINDYFALPNYFSTMRQAKQTISGKDDISINKNSAVQQSPSSSTSSKIALSVNRAHRPNNNFFSYHLDTRNKHLAIDSTISMPNKGIYKGSKLFIKHLNIKHLSINRDILLELKQLKDLAHENLIRFVGICAEDQHISILTEYCEKGNLRVNKKNSTLTIWTF